MIKNIFIPSSINGYFLSPQKISSFVFSSDQIDICEAIAKSRTINFKNFTTSKIEINSGLSYEEQAKSIIGLNLKSYKPAIISVSIPNTKVFFKEVTLPFLDKHKIENVLNFEIENSLPFSINSSQITFIILNQDKLKGSTTVLAAAVQNKDLEYYQELFKTINKKVDFFTIELFDNYELFKEILNKKGESVFINIENNSTTITHLKSNNLKSFRILPTGILDLINKKSQDSKDQDAYIEKDLDKYISDIELTLNNFSKDNNLKNIDTILLEKNNYIYDFSKILSQKLKLKFKNLDLNLIRKIKSFKIKKSFGLDKINFSNFSAIYTSTINNSYSLIKLDNNNESLLKKQIFVGLVLSLSIVGLLIANTFTEVGKLKTKIKKLETKTIKYLSKEISLDSRESKTLSRAINSAEEKVDQEAGIWFAFSKQTRLSFLEYLQELSEKINPVELGLKIKKLGLTNQTLIISGQVKDFKSLNDLSSALKGSNLFTLDKEPEDTDFEIKITLQGNSEEGLL